MILDFIRHFWKQRHIPDLSQEPTYRAIALEAVRWYENAAFIFRMAGMAVAEDPAWVTAARKVQSKENA